MDPDAFTWRTANVATHTTRVTKVLAYDARARWAKNHACARSSSPSTQPLVGDPGSRWVVREVPGRVSNTPWGYSGSMADQATRMNTTGATVDPVCGMPVAADGGIRVEHDGRVLVFCSTDCRDRFLADPDRYASVSATPSGHGADLERGRGSSAPVPDHEADHGADHGRTRPGLGAVDRVRLGMTARAKKRLPWSWRVPVRRWSTRARCIRRSAVLGLGPARSAGWRWSRWW